MLARLKSMVNGAHGASSTRDAEEAVVAVRVGAQRDRSRRPARRSCGGSRAPAWSPGLVLLQQRRELLEVGDRLAVDRVDRVAVLAACPPTARAR